MTDGPNTVSHDVDAYSPRQIAHRVETAGVGKAIRRRLKPLRSRLWPAHSSGTLVYWIIYLRRDQGA